MTAPRMRLGLWMSYLAGLRLAPFVPTPPHVARKMLDLAGVCSTDHVVDLGCGDGRLLVAAAKHYGATGYGVELDQQLFEQARKSISEESLEDQVRVEQRDAMSVDLSAATVVTLYLSEKGNDKLLPRLQQQLPRGARVVSFCWPFSKLEPCSVTRVDGINVYLYKPK